MPGRRIFPVPSVDVGIAPHHTEALGYGHLGEQAGGTGALRFDRAPQNSAA
jgi:hypothetical protein